MSLVLPVPLGAICLPQCQSIKLSKTGKILILKLWILLIRLVNILYFTFPFFFFFWFWSSFPCYYWGLLFASLHLASFTVAWLHPPACLAVCLKHAIGGPDHSRKAQGHLFAKIYSFSICQRVEENRVPVCGGCNDEKQTGPILLSEKFFGTTFISEYKWLRWVSVWDTFLFNMSSLSLLLLHLYHSATGPVTTKCHEQADAK